LKICRRFGGTAKKQPDGLDGGRYIVDGIKVTYSHGGREPFEGIVCFEEFLWE
jgi:hypothetical protein